MSVAMSYCAEQKAALKKLIEDTTKILKLEARDEELTKALEDVKKLGKKCADLQTRTRSNKITIMLYEKARKNGDLTSFENKSVQTTVNGYPEPVYGQEDEKVVVKKEAVAKMYIDPVLGIKRKGRGHGIENERLEKHMAIKEENKSSLHYSLGLARNSPSPSSSSFTANFASRDLPMADIKPDLGPWDKFKPDVTHDNSEPIELSDDDDIQPVDANGTVLQPPNNPPSFLNGLSAETQALIASKYPSSYGHH